MKSTALSTSLLLVIVLGTFIHGLSFLERGVPLSSTLNAASTGPPARLEIWSPVLHSSNLTGTSLFPIGSQFEVRVNVTNPRTLGGFDITLNYALLGFATRDPNVIEAVPTGTELSGGLFDPSQTFSNPNCKIIPTYTSILPIASKVHFGAVTRGGCSEPGTGVLFTVTFLVRGIGTSFIDIVLSDSLGQTVSSIVALSPTAFSLPFEPVNARFQNVPGVPPVARFTYSPLYPVKADNITFTGVESYDPDNSTMTGRGISSYTWILGDGKIAQGASQTHEYIYNLDIPLSGNFSVTLIVWDVDSHLPDLLTRLVFISRGIGQSASFNWSGYAVSSVQGGITDVRGSWIVPAIQGACGVTEEHSAFWVGIDGLNSPTVEQTGTDSACMNGVATYFAWYEFFPRTSHTIHAMNVNPGDVMYAEVSLSRERFNATIADLTTHASLSKFMKQKSELASSAEWIAEAPSSSTGILPLANFGTVMFGQRFTTVPGTCTATVEGLAGPIGSFGYKAQEITMITHDLSVKAQPSNLSADKSSFSVQWMLSGP